MKELKSFLAVAECLNFREAAERLGMSQPPLTRLIAQLESELGTLLFHRTTRKVELSGAGLHLYTEAKGMVARMEKLEKEIQEIGRLKSGKLKIGLHHSALHSELPKLISSYKDAFSGVSTEFSEVALSHVKHALKSGKLDLVIAPNKSTDPEIDCVEIMQKELGFLVKRDHPLARLKSAELRDLNGTVLIFHGRHDHLGFQKEFAGLLKRMKIRTVIYYKKAQENCSILAKEGKGILLTTKKQAKVHEKELVYVPFSDYHPRIKIYAHWRRGSHSVSLKAFLNFLFERTRVPSSEMDYHLA